MVNLAPRTSDQNFSLDVTRSSVPDELVFEAPTRG